MNDPDITWRRTFPDSAPGTDGVAIFEGRVIGRVRHRPAWSAGSRLVVERHRPGARRAAGLGQHARRNALAPAGHGPPDRALARAAGL